MSRRDPLQELQRFFGNNLDVDVLKSVLEMSNNNVSTAIQFLQASSEQLNDPDYVDPLKANEGGVPKDYMRKPVNWEEPKKEVMKFQGIAKIGNEIRKLIFDEKGELVKHLEYVRNDEVYPIYLSVVMLLLKQNCDLAFYAKWKILAGAFLYKKNDFMNYLLYETNQFNLPEVLKACKILDSQRKVRQLKKRIERLRKGGARKKTITKVQNKINEILKDTAPESEVKTSVSGSLAKKIRKWVGIKFEKSELAFFSIHLPKDPWKELADLIHFSPNDFKLKHFLPVTFGSEPPKDSLISITKTLNVKNVQEYVKKYEIPYSYLRKTIPVLTKETKVSIAKYEKLDTLIWYYEEFTSRGAQEEIDKIILDRLKKGETPSYNYGKLLERILYFKMNNSSFYEHLIPIAEKKLAQIHLPLETPFLIFGDASFSMDVSIRTSTIIASFVKAITDSKLKFFNESIFVPKYQPKTIEDVIDVALTTKAIGLTAPACCLEKYYKKKKVVKIFLLVTDEIENNKHGGMYFSQLFYKYYTEVYPAKLVLVSFLENPNANEKGRMVKALESFGIEPVNFVMHSIRPDLQKLDKIVGLLSLETRAFFHSVEECVKVAKEGGFSALSEFLKKERIVEKNEKKNKEAKFEDDVPENVKTRLEEKYKQFEKQKKEEMEDEKKKKNMDTALPKNIHIDSDEAPHEFICPITLVIMKDPVVSSDGYTYEREAITQWMEKNMKSPMTGKTLETKTVFPNQQLKSRIMEYLEKKSKENK